VATQGLIWTPEDAPMFKPYGEKARRFILTPPEQDKRITILEGSVRSSKTFAMFPKIVPFLNLYPVAGHRILFGVTKATVYRNILTYLFELVGERNYSYNRQTGELWLMGTRWSVIGAHDEGSEKYIRGLSVGIAVGDELTLMPESFTMMLLNRMSPTGARLYATTNPDSPYHYVKTKIIDNEEWRHHVNVIHFTLDDNPNLDEDYKNFVRKGYKGVYKLRFIDGLWVMAEGAIYADSLDADNEYDDESMPETLRVPQFQAQRCISMDYGTVHPHVYLDCIDDGDTVWFDREYFWDSTKMARQKTDSQYADDLELFMKGQPILGATAYTNPMPAADGALVIVPPECASFKAELSQRGIWHTDADNAVEDGIRMVSNMLARKKLKIHKKNCPNTLRQMQSYAWNPQAAKRGLEEPIKIEDDANDGLRYFVRTQVPTWRIAA